MFREMCLPKIKEQSSQNHSLQTCITPGRPDLLFHNVCGTPNSILFPHASANCSAWTWQAGNSKLRAEFQALLCPPGLTPSVRATLFQHKAQSSDQRARFLQQHSTPILRSFLFKRTFMTLGTRLGKGRSRYSLQEEIMIVPRQTPSNCHIWFMNGHVTHFWPMRHQHGAPGRPCTSGWG